MKTDRELLALAAKAAGYANPTGDDDMWRHVESGQFHQWNPLDDDGDSIRLAIKLDLWPYASSTNRIGVWRIGEDGLMKDIFGVDCWHGECHRQGNFERWEETKEAAVRRAIVIAAAKDAKS